jgi:pyroglutamyl-peptidase
LRRVLLTGFEPFAGYRVNPSGEIAGLLDGVRIRGVQVVGRLLPVDLARIERALAAQLRAVEPVAVVALGLAGGETAIRLERFAVNLADFTTADNAGAIVRSQPIESAGPAARGATLPLDAIQAALLKAGIPARQSNSAGTYLCNAAMYLLLRMLPPDVPCGFVHLPHLPEEAARLSALEGADPAASMALELQLRATRLVLDKTLEPSLRRSK